MKIRWVLSALLVLSGCAVEAAPEADADAPAVEHGATVHPERAKQPVKCYNACMAGAGRNPTWSDVQFCAYSCL
jgi:hypothetical protein